MTLINALMESINRARQTKAAWLVLRSTLPSENGRYSFCRASFWGDKAKSMLYYAPIIFVTQDIELLPVVE